MMKKIISLAFFCLLWCSSAFSQQQQLSLDEAVNIALKNNRDLIVAKLDVEKADAAVNEALGNALPSVGVSGNYTRNLKSPVFFIAGQPISIAQKNAFTATAQVTQVLFNSAVFTGVGTAKIYLDAAREQLRGKVAKTVADVKRAYYSVLFAQESVKLLKQSLQNGEENLKNVQTLFSQGLVAEYDVIRAEVSAENLRPSVYDAERKYIDAVNALKLTLGLNVPDSLNVQDSLNFSDQKTSSVKELQEKAIAANYDARSLKLTRQVNEELISIKRSEYLPTVSLFGNYTYQGSSDNFDFTTASSAAAGVQFSLSLFQGFQSSSRVEQAQIDFQRVSQQYESLAQSIRVQVESVFNQIENARLRVGSLGKTVDQAQRGYEIAQIRYNAGTGAQLEISDADLALRQARLNRIQAVYDFLVGWSQLDQLLGTVDQKYMDMVKIN